jgi:hypothetical protein
MLPRTWMLSFLLCIIFPFTATAQTGFKVEGFVLDADTRQPISGVSVVPKGTRSGVVTNDSGYFQFAVPNPVVTIVVSAIGYVPQSRQINVTYDSKGIEIELRRRANEQMDTVVVNAYKDNSKVKGVEMNIVRINPELIKRNPLLFGEADIIKTLVLQSGVTTAGEGAGGFNVRGGNADQNLVLLDGAPLFNTSHLLGFYTAVSPDAIQDLTLHKGSMPARYGGRIASLLNMNVKRGEQERMRYTTGIGPVSANFFASGPLVKNKLGITGGFRIAYPNLLLNKFPGRFGESRAFFYDGLLKAEYRMNDKHRISVTGYRSYDRFRFDTSTSYEWTTDLVTANYNGELSQKLSLALNAAYTRFNSGILGHDKGFESDLNSEIVQKQAKAMVTYKLSDKQKLDIGADFILYDISPGDQKPGSASSAVVSRSIQKESGREMAAFISDNIDISRLISLQLGLRYAYYNFLGPHDVYSYEAGVPLSRETITGTNSFSKNKSIESFGGLEPRVALKLGFSEQFSLKLGYNRAQQFLHLISNTTAISPVDFWKLSDSHIPRQQGDQYSIGAFHSFHNNAYEISIESYYKTTKDIVQYKDGASLLLNPYIETALLKARGRAYGAELSFAKNLGKLTGQINYAYSRSEVQVLSDFASEKVNGGNWYAADIDRPHNLSLLGKLKLGRGWSFNANFVYTSGRPATFPDGNYAYNGTLVNNYSKRNHDRLPDYHRLDLGFSYVSKRYPDQWRYSVVNFSVYNVYSHDNAYSIFFRRNLDNLDAYQLSVIGGIIPSISWNYNF